MPEFKRVHDCQNLLTKCSFFIKERIKQIKVDTKVKIRIKQVDNVYLVKADALIYPNNILLEIDDPVLSKMTNNQLKTECKKITNKGVKMGYPYVIKCDQNWKLKQQYFINAVVAGESRLVNENDVASSMKKSLLLSDQMSLESVVIMPCDYGTHDISLISLSQLSSIFMFCKQHNFESLKSIYICMQDEESEQAFIEYYNRIFGGDTKHDFGNGTNSTESN